MKATSRPLLVVASRTPCEAIAAGTLVDLKKICEFITIWNKIFISRVACKKFSNRAPEALKVVVNLLFSLTIHSLITFVYWLPANFDEIPAAI